MDPVQILAEIGVDVWRLRTSPEPASELVGSGVDSVEPELVLAEPEGSRGLTAPLAESSSVSPESAPVAAFDVLSLSSRNALLLVELGDLKSGQRFAADLLSAATGEWGNDHGQLLFSWPQAGIDNSEASMTRALSAFIDKQLSDAAVTRVLISAEVAGRVTRQNLPESYVCLPAFGELMVSGELKRSVWTEISSLWH
jgi:hypothetical protein